MVYIKLEFYDISTIDREMIIAKLGDSATGFEETEKGLIVYYENNKFSTELLKKESLSRYEYSISEIEMTNWNALWESNFEPIRVDNFVGVRADFHAKMQDIAYELIITPKMSFGTGHHATTYLMMAEMEKIDFKNKTVFDFGTGTGILAILASKLGAAQVLATDIDQWCIDNSLENIEKNYCTNIEVRLSDKADQQDTFDIIIANINKNVLMSAIPILEQQLAKNGTILLSGLLSEDEIDIMQIAKSVKLDCQHKNSKNGWIVLKMNRMGD